MSAPSHNGSSSAGPLRALLSGFRFGEFLIASLLSAGILIAILPGYVRGRERARVAQTRALLRQTAIGISSYQIDHGAYPASGIAAGESRHYESQQIWQPTAEAVIPAGVPTINSFAPTKSGARRLVTFRIATQMSAGQASSPLASLSTPVAYLDRFPEDPYMHTGGASFGYFAHGSGLGWILFSMGPDRDENVNDGPGDLNAGIQKLYNINEEFPYMWQRPPDLIDLTYDPSNGILSNGDIYFIQGD